MKSWPVFDVDDRKAFVNGILVEKIINAIQKFDLKCSVMFKDIH
jgi:hypothetical protein